MKTTQTYAFIKTKKEISMSKEAFSAFVDTKDKDLLAQIASLPEFNIADASINKYVEFLVNAVRKSDQKSNYKATQSRKRYSICCATSSMFERTIMNS